MKYTFHGPLFDMISTVAWIRDFLQEIECKLDPPLLLEDKKAAIIVVINGSSTAAQVRRQE